MRLTARDWKSRTPTPQVNEVLAKLGLPPLDEPVSDFVKGCEGAVIPLPYPKPPFKTWPHVIDFKHWSRPAYLVDAPSA